MLKIDQTTGEVSFAPPAKPHIIHRRHLQAAYEELAREANVLLSDDCQATLAVIRELLSAEAPNES